MCYSCCPKIPFEFEANQSPEVNKEQLRAGELHFEEIESSKARVVRIAMNEVFDRWGFSKNELN